MNFSLNLFELEGLAQPAQPTQPARSAPKARIDRKAEYEALQDDCAFLLQHWEDLHLWVLERQITLYLDPMTGPQERADLWDWLHAPATARPAPFSFIACLALYDPRLDEDVVLGLIQRRLRSRRRSL